MRIKRGCGCLVFFVMALIGAVGIVGGAVLVNLEIPPNSELREYFPHPDGYNYTNVTISAVIDSAKRVADLNGQKQTSVLVDKVGAFFECMQDQGSFESRVYVSGKPSGGIVFIIDVNRSSEVLSECLLTGLTRRSVGPEEPRPCLGYGGFSSDNKQLFVLFAASHESLCGEFGDHFEDSYSASMNIVPLRAPSE